MMTCSGVHRAAGFRRVAPSEWGGPDWNELEGVPWDVAEEEAAEQPPRQEVQAEAFPFGPVQARLPMAPKRRYVTNRISLALGRPKDAWHVQKSSWWATPSTPARTSAAIGSGSC